VKPYVLTQGAAADIRNITRYTLETWGHEQCTAYIEQIEQAASDVATGQGVFKDMGTVLPGLRMKRVAQHCIFCVPQASGPALILAVLHQRMDLMARLKNRLE
jgi:toxin ParE1/3/4